MKNLLNISIIILILTAFTTLAISAEVKRNKSNNKLGITKITTEERENSFMHKLINNELNFSNESDDTKASKAELDEIKDEVKNLIHKIVDNIDKTNNNKTSNERILHQIKILSDLRNDNILTEDEFITKKKILLDKIN